MIGLFLLKFNTLFVNVRRNDNKKHNMDRQ